MRLLELTQTQTRDKKENYLQTKIINQQEKCSGGYRKMILPSNQMLSR